MTRSHGGLSADQIVVQSGTHLWAGFVAIRGAVGQMKKLGKFVGTRFSDPVEVSTFEVNDDGVAIIDFVIPNVPAGEHHLELRGDDGSVYRTPILVTDTPVTDAPPPGESGDWCGSAGSRGCSYLFVSWLREPKTGNCCGRGAAERLIATIYSERQCIHTRHGRR